MYLVLRYSSMPSKEPSRPRPDILTPPKGEPGVRRIGAANSIVEVRECLHRGDGSEDLLLPHCRHIWHVGYQGWLPAIAFRGAAAPNPCTEGFGVRNQTFAIVQRSPIN